MVAWAIGNSVVVLGAGATRGAEFVGRNPRSPALPPLNADFFTQLQKVQAKSRQADIDAVLKDVMESFGSNFNLSLEEYFTHIEALRRGGSLFLTRGSKSYSPTRMASKRRNLLDALSAVLEESADVTRRDSPAVRNPCRYHQQIVEALNPPDSIISFNYDCVIDHTLRSSTRPIFSAKHGYGFPNASRIDEKSANVWSTSPPAEGMNATIRLYKLHGSLNWRPLSDDRSDEIRFREKIYKQKGQKAYEIIPPEFLKEIQREPFNTLWSRAASSFRGAQNLALIGFSFPPTDQLVEAMFRMGLEENRNLRRLVIVNPSRQDRDRIRRVCAEILKRRPVRVVQFDYLKEFAPYAGELLP
jgi:hypothetical protein